MAPKLRDDGSTHGSDGDDGDSGGESAKAPALQKAKQAGEGHEEEEGSANTKATEEKGEKKRVVAVWRSKGAAAGGNSGISNKKRADGEKDRS